tara:strand:- start:876 stop:1124 length:249 start_codon:yes stop_codon:yes gene_type:complete
MIAKDHVDSDAHASKAIEIRPTNPTPNIKINAFPVVKRIAKINDCFDSLSFKRWEKDLFIELLEVIPECQRTFTSVQMLVCD